MELNDSNERDYIHGEVIDYKGSVMSEKQKAGSEIGIGESSLSLVKEKFGMNVVVDNWEKLYL